VSRNQRKIRRTNDFIKPNRLRITPAITVTKSDKASVSPVGNTQKCVLARVLIRVSSKDSISRFSHSMLSLKFLAVVKISPDDTMPSRHQMLFSCRTVLKKIRFNLKCFFPRARPVTSVILYSDADTRILFTFVHAFIAGWMLGSNTVAAISCFSCTFSEVLSSFSVCSAFLYFSFFIPFM